MNPLAVRLAKLESKNPAPEENRPWISAVGDHRDHDALYRLLEAEGCDIGPDSPDNFIIHWIVRPASQADTELLQPYITATQTSVALAARGSETRVQSLPKINGRG